MQEEETASFHRGVQAVTVKEESPFQRGRFVKHYAHGVGVITDIVEQELYGTKLRLIHVLVGSLKLQVPEGKAKDQLFSLSSKVDWETALPLLASDPKPLGSPWHRTATDLAARLEVGTLVSVCEVLRDTAPREEAAISFSRREVFDTALTRLVEEYRVTFEVSREDALIVLQGYCPFDISKQSSGRQNVVTRTRNVRRVKTGEEGYRELYQPKPRQIREKVAKPPTPKREPKVKTPKPPRPPRVLKPRPLNKQEQILALTEKVESLTVQLALVQESVASERLLEAARIANLEAAFTASQATIKELTRTRGVLQSQVTRLKNGKKSKLNDNPTAKEIRAKISAVRTELFQYIFERTGIVERLQAYIRELQEREK